MVGSPLERCAEYFALPPAVEAGAAAVLESIVILVKCDAMRCDVMLKRSACAPFICE